ncbi:MAG: family 10 glycosylhydrolase, partial [bacterium]|nr:family 10 glycosylhydrolase [bacterium]
MFLGRFFCHMLVAGLLAVLGAPPSLAQAAKPAGGAPQSAADVQHLGGAIWVSAGDGRYRDPLKLGAFVDDLKNLPFGEVIVQVRASGDAYYNSTLVPRALGVPEQYDPLAEMIKAFHAAPRLKKVIAWINPWLVGNENTPTPFSNLHVTAAHPDWLSVRADGSKSDSQGRIYLEPSLPAVEKHLDDVVTELARNYSIDGLYIGPMIDGDGDGQWGFQAEVLAQWQAQTGSTVRPSPDDPKWIAFRADLLTRALRGMAQAAHAVKPSLLVAVGAETDGGTPAEGQFQASTVYSGQHQDWPLWMRDKLVGRIYLENFKTDAMLAGSFDAWMKLAVALAGQTGVPVYIGVGGQQNESVMALAQMRRAAESGAEGVALFDYTTPIIDRGSSALFYNAIGRAVFGPGLVHKRSLARVGPVKLEPVLTTGTQTFAPPTTGAQTTAAAPPSKVVAAAAPTAPATAPAPAASPAGAPLELPPPPVPDEGSGEMIPVYPESGKAAPTAPSAGAAAGAGLTVAELKALAGTRADESATSPTATAAA